MTLGTDGAGPYTPYPPVHDPRRDQPPSTAMASWAFGLSLIPVPLTMILSFIFAVIVLNRCGDGRNHGKKRAITAIVLVCVWVLGYAALIIGLAAGEAERDGTGSVSVAGHVSVYDLSTGDCMPDDSLSEGQHTTVEVVPCSEPHLGEVYDSFDLAKGDYPGDDEVIRLSEGGCLKRLEDATGMVWEDMPYEMFYYYPLELDWTNDRTVSCVVIYPEEQRGMLEDIAPGDLPLDDASAA